MKVKSILFVVGVILLFASSCTSPSEAPAPLDMDQIKADLQAMEDAYAVAQNAKDAEGVVAYYAEDAVNLPDGEPPIVGKAAILERIKAEMNDTSSATIAFEVVNVWAAGDIAVEVGKSTVTTADGSTHTGKYVSIFEKRDGKYICVRDIWNEDTKDDDDDDENGDDDESSDD